MTARIVFERRRVAVVPDSALEAVSSSGLGTDLLEAVKVTPGQLWERLAAHSEIASGYEEDITSSGEVDNYKDTDEYLFSED